MKNIDIDKLTSLCEKKDEWSDDEKAMLKGWLVEAGVEVPKKTKCKNCWRDAAILLACRLKGESGGDCNGFRLRGTAAKNGVLWLGRLVSPATIDDDLIAWLKQTGFPKHHYDED